MHASPAHAIEDSLYDEAARKWHSGCDAKTRARLANINGQIDSNGTPRTFAWSFLMELDLIDALRQRLRQNRLALLALVRHCRPTSIVGDDDGALSPEHTISDSAHLQASRPDERGIRR